MNVLIGFPHLGSRFVVRSDKILIDVRHLGSKFLVCDFEFANFGQLLCGITCTLLFRLVPNKWINKSNTS